MANHDGRGGSDDIPRRTLQGVAVPSGPASNTTPREPSIPPSSSGVPNPANRLEPSAPAIPSAPPPREWQQPHFEPHSSQPHVAPQHGAQPHAAPQHGSQPHAAPQHGSQPQMSPAALGRQAEAPKRAPRVTARMPSESSGSSPAVIPFSQAPPQSSRPATRADGAVGDGPIRVVCRRCQRPVWGWKLPFGVSCALGPHHAHLSWLLVGVVASFWAAFGVVMISLLALIL